MVAKAESSQIGEIAFAAAFCHRQNMVCVPERLSSSQFPVSKCLGFGQTALALQVAHCGDAIETALCANATVALQNTLPEMTWVGANPPFFYTPVRAKSEPSRRNLQVAPAAERTAIIALG